MIIVVPLLTTYNVVNEQKKNGKQLLVRLVRLPDRRGTFDGIAAGSSFF